MTSVDRPPAPSLTRLTTTFDPLPALSDLFLHKSGSKSYTQQYANIYFIRLRMLGGRALQSAQALWDDQDPKPKHVQRILDVEQGELCYIVGTVYMDMPLKPSVLDDITKEQWVTAPPPRTKFCGPDDEMMLEDESGRVKLVGDRLATFRDRLVTGIIVGVLGAETSAGDFEVVDICFPGLPKQMPAVNAAVKAEPAGNDDDNSDEGPWVAIASGLDVGASNALAEMRLQLLVEMLTGELGGEEDQVASAKISRLIIAGNSMAQPVRAEDDKKAKRYGYDSSTYSDKPTTTLDELLTDIASTMKVDLMPGENDPAAVTMPQQPVHFALLPRASRFDSLNFRSNPWWAEIAGRTFLGTSGQTLDDIFKYVESDDRLQMACDTLEWNHIAPTAPDTLWCYPFVDRDPFVISQSPHVYFAGNQPRLESKLIQGGDKEGGSGEGQPVLVVLVPRFAETGEVALVNCRTLECRRLCVEVPRAWMGEEER